MTFYLDIILVENMIMNYIILFATGIIIRIKLKQIRLLLASLLGSIYAIMSYISSIGIYLNQITKIVLSVAMVYIAFCPSNFKRLVKELLIFYLTSFCFGGAAFYLLYYIKPSQINNTNVILTGSYPIKIAILGGILGFIVIYLSFKIVKSKINKNTIYYNVEIAINNKNCMVRTILDTGNLLVEPITLSPVIIIEKTAIEKLISKDIINCLLEVINSNNFENIPEDIRMKCRFIPYSSIGKNNGMIIGIKPDYVKIYDEDVYTTRNDVIIGISNHVLSKNGTYSGLIGLECLNNEIEKNINYKESVK